jgi:hypothetical protein
MKRVLSNVRRAFPQYSISPPPLLLSTLEGKEYTVLVNELLIILESEREVSF